MSEVNAKQATRTKRPTYYRFIAQIRKKFHHTTNKLNECSRPMKRIAVTAKNSAGTAKPKDDVGKQTKNIIKETRTTDGVDWTTTRM